MKSTLSLIAIIASLLLAISACKVRDAVVTVDDECAEYTEFMANHFINNGYGYFEVKPLAALHQKFREGKIKYPFSPCLRGKDKAYVRAIFGTPHQEIIIPHYDYNVFIYNFGNDMEHLSCYGGFDVGFLVKFDQDDKFDDIISTYTPYDAYRNR